MSCGSRNEAEWQAETTTYCTVQPVDESARERRPERADRHCLRCVSRDKWVRGKALQASAKGANCRRTLLLCPRGHLGSWYYSARLRYC